MCFTVGCSGLSDVPNGGGGGGGNQNSSVQIAPLTATVNLYGAQTFTATVTGPNTAVTWQVNGATGGSAATGTISTAGVFSAPHSITPSMIPANNAPVTVTVTAVSQANSANVATATVTLVPQQQVAQKGAVLLGTSGGNINDTNNGFCCSGTLGSLLTLSGTDYILSNNHVLAKSDTGNAGDAISQPGLIDVPSPNTCTAVGTETVAHLYQYFNLQTGPTPKIDAALAQIVSGQVDTSGNILLLGATATSGIPDPGAPHAGSGVAATPGQNVAKSGRTTGLTCSTVLGTNVSSSVDYYAHCGDTIKAFTVTYTDLVSVTGGTFSGEGDSGSLIVTETTADPVALLFAGSDTDSVGNPVSDVLSAFVGAGNATPSFVGGAAHQIIGCTLPQASKTASLAPQAQVAPETMKAASLTRDLQAPNLLANTAIHAIGLGQSYDHPGQAAILLFLNRGTGLALLPKSIDGVRTRVVKGDAWAYRGLLSSDETTQMMQTVAAPQIVYAVTLAEMQRAKAVHDTHAEELLKNPDVVGVGITSSVDSPGEAALLIYVKKGAGSKNGLPLEIDGLRTRIRETGPFIAGRDRDMAKTPASCKPRSVLPSSEAPQRLVTTTKSF